MAEPHASRDLMWESMRHESKFIQRIVEEIFHKSSSSFSSFNDSVGIDSLVDKLYNSYLNLGNNVCMTGIFGMGGLGKTTLARVVYDMFRNRFEGSSFIANVREDYEKHRLHRLQQQLLADILEERNIDIRNEYQGVGMIKNRLCHKKILLVLDDVDRLDQLEKLSGESGWFGLGSWIIITTRDEHLLVQHEVHNRYKLDALNSDVALKLFCLKAFKKEQPKEGYMQLSQEFVHYANGLPLALVTLGSFLCRRSMDEWKSALASVKKNPKREIFDSLKVSYDGLEETWREIFLDIACFFRGKAKDRVVEILENCGLDARGGMNVLMQRSLITIENNKLCMHDLLQKMGEEIVRQESRGEPGKRSRLWLLEDLFHVLTKNTATEAIKAIVINRYQWDRGDWTFEAPFYEWEVPHWNFEVIPEAFSKMVLPSSFQPRELVELNLQFSEIKYLWEGVKYLDKLKCMDLSYSARLVHTPDFNGFPRLERLILSCCTNLVDIHPSIGQLKRLVVLDLEHCVSLTNLPSISTEMESLQILNLFGCEQLREIPEFNGILKSLSKLYLGRTRIATLPSSIDCLTALTILNLEYCLYLNCLPSNMNGLISLKKLVLTGCFRLKDLPESIWKIECLKELELIGTSIWKLPSANDVWNDRLKEQFVRNIPWSYYRLPQPSEPSYDEVSRRAAFTILNRYLQGLLRGKTEFQTIIPGYGIPGWITYTFRGDSIRIALCPNWCNSKWMGFILSAHINVIEERFGLGVRVKALGDIPHSQYASKTFFRITASPQTAHYNCLLYLCRDDWFAAVPNADQCSLIEVVFENYGSIREVMHCGVGLVYEQDVEEFNQTIAQTGESPSHYGLNGVEILE
nr:TMV resistance protein N-like [Quercus suber]